MVSGNKAVFIEVKQATIYMQAKISGDLEKLKSDLSKTIGHGVLQLIEFESDWRTREYNNLKKFDDITHYEWLIITYDKAYYGNWILKKQIEKLIQDSGKEIPKGFYWHTISIEELEYFVGMYEEELFEILVEKRLDDKDESMDFREFMAIKQKDLHRNPFLESVYGDFFKQYGIGD